MVWLPVDPTSISLMIGSISSSIVPSHIDLGETFCL